MDTNGREELLHFDEDDEDTGKFDKKAFDDMKSSIQEIQTTNKFILKRLTSQQEQLEQRKGCIIDIPDDLMSRLGQLEIKDKEQEEEMRRLMNCVSSIGDKISSVCQVIDSITSTTATASLDSSPKIVFKHKNAHSSKKRRKDHNNEINSDGDGELHDSLSVKERQKAKANDERDVDMKNQTCDLSEHSTIDSHANNRQLNMMSESVPSGTDVDRTLTNTEQNMPDRTTDSTVHNGGARPKSKPVPSGTDVDWTHTSTDQKMPGRSTDNIVPNSGARPKSKPVSIESSASLSLPRVSHDEDKDNKKSMDSQSSFQAGADLQAVDDEMWMSTVEYESNRAKESELPCGTGIDTVFLLDVSDSMRGEGLKQLQNVCYSILDDLEKSKTEENLDENVSVVTFGGETKCVQFLTNDYRATRKLIDEIKVGGASPLGGGLMMSLAPMKQDGTTTMVVYGFEIQPRIILISDGRATDARYPSGPEDAGMYVQSEVDEAVMKVAESLSQCKVCVFCVPVGDADETLLRKIATETHGTLVAPSQIDTLGRHFRNLATVMEAKKDFPPGLLRKEDLETVLKLKRKDVKEQDIVDMIKILSNPAYIPLLNIDEDEEFQELEESNTQMPPIGTRVRRGPDWKWKNQDCEGPGTVVGHGKNGWIKVEWDTTNKGVYRYGVENHFDVIVADEPRVLKQELIATGCLVKRGDQWRHGSQDGGPGKIGVVYKVERNGQIWVRWPNKEKHSYSYGGLDGRLEVQICDPFEVRAELAAQEESAATVETGTASIATKSSRSPSITSSSDISDDPLSFRSGGITPPMESEPADGMSIYDMAPPPVEKERSQEEEAVHLSLIEAMNRRNESPAKSTNQLSVSDVEQTNDARVGISSGDAATKDTIRPKEELPEDYLNVYDTEGPPGSEEISPFETKNERLSVLSKDSETTGNISQVVTAHEQHAASGTVYDQKEKEQITEDTIGHDYDYTDNKTSINQEQKFAAVNITNSVNADLGIFSEDVKIADESCSSDGIQKSDTNNMLSLEGISKSVESSTPNQNISSSFSVERMSNPIQETKPYSVSLGYNKTPIIQNSSKINVNIVGNSNKSTDHEPRKRMSDSCTSHAACENLDNNSSIKFTRDRTANTSQPQQESREHHPAYNTDKASDKNHSDVKVEQSPLTLSEISAAETNLEWSMLPNRESSRFVKQDSDQLQLQGANSSRQFRNPNILTVEQTLKGVNTLSETFSDTASVVSEVSTVVPTDSVWQWQDEGGTWHSYPEDMNLKIEKARKRGNKATALVQLQGESQAYCPLVSGKFWRTFVLGIAASDNSLPGLPRYLGTKGLTVPQRAMNCILLSYRVVIYKGVHLHTVTREEYKIRCLESSNDIANVDDMDVL